MTNSFLLVFYGALLALGVAELVKRWKFLIEDTYWEYALWSVLFFMVATYNWFIMKSRLEFVSESYLNFMIMMIPPILFFLLVSVFVPEEHEKVREHFDKKRSLVFGIMALFTSANILAAYLNGDDNLFMLSVRSVAVLLAIIASFWDSIIPRMLLAAHIIVSVILIFIQ